jgi:hypothetical protein
MPCENPRIAEGSTSCRLAAGTRIAIPTVVAESATRRVQDLKAKDLVFAGMPGAFMATPILGITKQTGAPVAPIEANIVRVRAGAIGLGQPQHELLLPHDALLIFECVTGPDTHALAPIAALANGLSIVRESVQRSLWYDIAMEGSAILLVDGVGVATFTDPVADTTPPAPSSRPTLGKRTRNGSKARPHTRPTAVHPPGPRSLLPGPELLALRHRLNERARIDGVETVARSPALAIGRDDSFDPANPVRLFVNETEIPRDPNSSPTMIRFRLPTGGGPVRLASASALSPQPDDSRQLGICVTNIEIDGVPLNLAGPEPGPGFHPLELAGDAQWRWTNGDAWLVLAQRLLPQTLTLHLNDWHLHLHPAAP